MNFNELSLNKKDWICLAIVIIFSLLCTAKMMMFTMSGCILDPDIALYLLSALKYAGLDSFNVAYPEDLFYTPIISFLTSLIFRMGYVDKNAIIIVTSILSFLGYVGLYCLLKRRFDSLLSLTGVAIYGSILLVIFNISKGMVDIPCLSLSIWALLFAIMAIDDDPKYFFVAFPLLTIAFFTKYTAGFTLPLIILYYCMKRDIVGKFDCLLSDRETFKQEFKSYLHSKEFKYIIISLLASLVLTVIICKTLILDFGGSLTFFDQSVNTFNGHSFSKSGVDHVSSKSYYVKRFTDMLFGSSDHSLALAWLAYGICGLGLAIKFIKNFSILKSEKEPFKTRYLNKALIISCFVLLFVSFLTFKVIPNHMACNISILIALTFVYSILEKYDFDNKIVSLDLLFLACFLINFIFASLYGIKVERYALPFVPPIIYFIVLGLEGIVEAVDFNGLSKLRLDTIIPIIIIILFMTSTACFLAPIEYERTNDVIFALNYQGFKGDLSDACDYIKNNVSDYHNETFASNYHHSRIIRWYLNVNVTVLDKKDPGLHEFDNTTYAILSEDLNLTNYHKIKNFGDFDIYKRN